MKKLLISTILGGVLTCPAPASIVSRGFLEETLDSYATNTALDLKVNQNDFNQLYDKLFVGWKPCDTCSTFNLDKLASDYKLVWEYFGDVTVGLLLTHGTRDPKAYEFTNGEELQIPEYARVAYDVQQTVKKIGELPDGYSTIGDALSALNAKIDGKINNLSTTASNGKYVLTAVKEGDQTTYAWEPIDRSETESATPTDE